MDMELHEYVVAGISALRNLLEEMTAPTHPAQIVEEHF